MNRFFVLSLILLIPASTQAADPTWPKRAPMSVLHEIDEHDGELLHTPGTIDFGPDGRAYVLCLGESRVRVFNEHWESAGSFGAPGEGPGEFEQATTLVVVGSEVRVFQPYRQVVFDLDGTWLRIDRLDVWVLNTVAIDDTVWAVAYDHDRVGVALGAGGEVLAEFGPANPWIKPADRMERGHWSYHWQLLQSPAGRLQLFNSFDALWLEGVAETPTVLLDLTPVLGQGTTTIKTSEKDGVMTVNSTTWTPLIGASIGPEGRVWSYAREHGLVMIDHQRGVLGQWDQPEERVSTLCFISPRHEFVTVKRRAGWLTVYTLPTTP